MAPQAAPPRWIRPAARAKFSTWEGGMCDHHARPGKIPAGSVYNEVAAACDLLPTFAKLAKAELPKRKIDGKNIWRLMSGRNGAKSPHKAFYFYRGTGLRAVRRRETPHRRCGRKQKQDDKKPALSLYNLSKDIGETTDVAAENEKIVQRIQAAQAFIRPSRPTPPPAK